MTNESHPHSELIAEYLATFESRIQTRILENGIIENIIDECISALDDAITDEMPFPEYDISDDDNEEIAFSIQEIIRTRIISHYFPLANRD